MEREAATAQMIPWDDPGPLITLAPEGLPQRTVRWGHAWQHGSASYWVACAAEFQSRATVPVGRRHRLTESLREELALCLLGGFGMPAEVGLAAFQRVRGEGLLAPGRLATTERLRDLLAEPLPVGGGLRRYRFPNQRAARLAAALQFVGDRDPDDAVELRAWLLQAPGVGPKTASWIVRNHLGADMAILDVHVIRAGRRAGVLPEEMHPNRHYFQLERLFLEWARRGDVRGADLDAVIWREGAEAVRRPHSARRPAC